MSIVSQLYNLVVKFHFQVHTFDTNLVYIGLSLFLFPQQQDKPYTKALKKCIYNIVRTCMYMTMERNKGI